MANEPEGHKRRLINTIIIIIVRQVQEKEEELLVSEEEEQKGAGGRKEEEGGLRGFRVEESLPVMHREGGMMSITGSVVGGLQQCEKDVNTRQNKHGNVTGMLLHLRTLS